MSTAVESGVEPNGERGALYIIVKRYVFYVLKPDSIKERHHNI